MLAELVREQVLRRTRQEVPHAVEVQVEEIEERDGLVAVRALLWVETESQKGILIGAGGRDDQGDRHRRAQGARARARRRTSTSTCPCACAAPGAPTTRCSTASASPSAISGRRSTPGRSPQAARCVGVEVADPGRRALAERDLDVARAARGAGARSARARATRGWRHRGEHGGARERRRAHARAGRPRRRQPRRAPAQPAVGRSERARAASGHRFAERDRAAAAPAPAPASRGRRAGSAAARAAAAGSRPPELVGQLGQQLREERGDLAARAAAGTASARRPAPSA